MAAAVQRRGEIRDGGAPARLIISLVRIAFRYLSPSRRFRHREGAVIAVWLITGAPSS
jgi:hypothetical protein